jgi:hypothetical protein
MYVYTVVHEPSRGRWYTQRYYTGTVHLCVYPVPLFDFSRTETTFDPEIGPRNTLRNDSSWHRTGTSYILASYIVH